MGKTVGGESFRGKTELNFGHIILRSLLDMQMEMLSKKLDI